MTTPHDPRAIALSHRVYRALLRAYPRRFRLQYREEMALVFRDSCRDAYRRQGRKGLIAVWRRGFTDLGVNAPKELSVAMVEETALRPWGRSCSGCNNEVAPDWRQCQFCGTFLSAGTTYPTHVVRVRQSFGSTVDNYLEQEKRAALCAVGMPGDDDSPAMR